MQLLPPERSKFVYLGRHFAWYLRHILLLCTLKPVVHSAGSLTWAMGPWPKGGTVQGRHKGWELFKILYPEWNFVVSKYSCLHKFVIWKIDGIIYLKYRFMINSYKMMESIYLYPGLPKTMSPFSNMQMRPLKHTRTITI